MHDPALEHSMEVFARGFAFTRSFTRPYIASRFNDAWWLRDGPETRKRRRNDEWIAPCGVEPEKLDQWARERAKGGFLISAVAGSPTDETGLRVKYRSLGYRLWRTEPLMARSTLKVPRFEARAVINLVDTLEMASELAKAARGQMVPSEYLGSRSSPLRCHVATVAGNLVGWVQSITIAESGWCANLFVKPEFRRRGIGRALVGTMLRADRAAGLTASILAARHAGAKLYAATGYHSVGTVLVFTPIR